MHLPHEGPTEWNEGSARLRMAEKSRNNVLIFNVIQDSAYPRIHLGSEIQAFHCAGSGDPSCAAEGC